MTLGPAIAAEELSGGGGPELSADEKERRFGQLAKATFQPLRCAVYGTPNPLYLR